MNDPTETQRVEGDMKENDSANLEKPTDPEVIGVVVDTQKEGETLPNQQQATPTTSTESVQPPRGEKGLTPPGFPSTGNISPISGVTRESWADATDVPVVHSSTQVHTPDFRPSEKMVAKRVLDRLMMKVTAINELYEDIVALDERKATLCEVECYESMINEEWKEFNELQSTIVVDLNIPHEYHEIDGYQQATRERRSALLATAGKKSKIRARQQDSTAGKTPSSTHLERITIGTFNGDFTAWKGFSDLYQNMIGRTDISNVEKLVRLKGALTGPAAELLKTFPITEESYDLAWEKLKNAYENPRLIAQTLFERVLNMPKIKKASAHQIAQNRSTAKETFDQLRASAGISTEQLGEQFIVHLLLNSLDAETRKDLEVKAGASTKFTRLNDLVAFLDSTARGLRVSGAGDKQASTQQSNQRASSHQVSSTEGGSTATKETRSSKCACCQGGHFVGKCPKFRSLSILKKRELIVKERLCYNCLGTHNASKCASSKFCLRCDGKHHTLICEKGLRNPATHASSTTSTETSQSSIGQTPTGSVMIPERKPTPANSTYHSIASTTNVAVHHQASTEPRQNVLLATAKAKAYSSTGSYILIRMLIDQGSELTFIAEHLVNQLRLHRSSSTIHLTGIGITDSGHTRGVVSIQLESIHEPHQYVNLRAHVLGRLTTRLPSFTGPSVNIKSLRQLQLADEHFMRPGPIDLLIGADNYGQITGHQSLAPENSHLVGQLTIFGWTLSGPLNCTDLSTGRVLTTLRDDSTNEQLLQLLQKFWVQEEPPISQRSTTDASSPEDQACEQHFQSTHQRDSSGRYIIRLPIRDSPARLGESRSTALRQLHSVNRRLKSDINYNQLYTDFINEYESLQHMRRSPTTPEPSPAYYLPHHGVLKAESLSTKLRVVFNGSSKTTTGVSLNDILYTGEKLQVDAMAVLTYMRRHRYVFGTDIKKMFRQIRVHEDHWDLQRILWINEEDKIVSYQLTTVTYGLSCSPWLSLRVLQQLVTDEGHRFPNAVPALTQGRYVDDIYGGAENEAELEETIHQLQQLCMAGGFPLAKWSSNKEEVLQRLGLPIATSPTISFEETLIKVLGVCWHPSTDTFQFQSRQFNNQNLSKRTLLSEIAQIFDPLGFISPVIIKAKVLIQDLWTLKLGWDDTLPEEYCQRWGVFREELAQLDQLAIPRWLGLAQDNMEIQLHGFADASTTAMGAVVYLRCQRLNETPSITLVCAKTKVAPLKRLTIPRLELSAALMLTGLVQHVQRILELDNTKLILWTDSSVALAWINSHPSRWKEYVHNRVVKIQDTLPNAEWRHVSGTDNPADCASRGISTSQLVNHQLWWTGPSWLQGPENSWPQTGFESTIGESTPEEKPAKAHPVAAQRANELLSLLERYSKLSRALQVMATIQRAIRRFRRQPVPESPILTTVELEEARLIWVQLVQREYYQREIQILTNGNQLPGNHRLINLTPMIDDTGIMRLGGRLTNAPLSHDQIHPIILPKESRLSELIIRHAHLRTLHGGTQLTLAYVREKYWIIGGRPTVKTAIHRCLRCTRFRALRAYQLMGQLPASRVTPARAFQHTGVDYAGPIPILKWTGKGARTQTGYIAVFVCFATLAMHLELVSRQTTDAFIAAYKRFTGRRGIPEVMYSDRGAAFVGAQRILGEAAENFEAQQQDVIKQVTSNGTQWKFSPPRAAHFGGKWEAGVESVKHHLKRVIGDSHLTFEELTTLLVQIEAILNSRPLSQLSDDPTDSTALTPGHFLTGGPLLTVPEPSRLHESTIKPPRWKWITQKTQDFWNQWYRECIQRHQSISKWRETNQNIHQGQLVLVSEDGQSPSRWPLALVVKRYFGKDGLVRVVDLRCNKKIIKRSIHTLCVLPLMPINEPEDEDVTVEEEMEPRPDDPPDEDIDDQPGDQSGNQPGPSTSRASPQDAEDEHPAKRIKLG